MTVAVAQVVRERLDRLRRERQAGLADRLLAIGKDCAAHLKEPFRSVEHGDWLSRIVGLADADDDRRNPRHATQHRISALEYRFTALKNRFAAMEGQLGGIETRLSAIENRIDAVEERMSAMLGLIVRIAERVVPSG